VDCESCELAELLAQAVECARRRMQCAPACIGFAECEAAGGPDGAWIARADAVLAEGPDGGGAAW
jgi:hypothetical protein